MRVAVMDGIADFLGPLDDLSGPPPKSGGLWGTAAEMWSSAMAWMQGSTPVEAHILDDYEIIEYQKDTEWCWAITAVSIFNCYCSRKTQRSRFKESVCDLVRKQSATECGANCERCKGQPGDLGKRLERCGCCTIDDEKPSTAAFGVVKEQMVQKRPVGVRIEYDDASMPHYVVIVGCVTGANSAQYLLIHDPAVNDPDPTHIPYESLRAGYPQSVAKWKYTIYTHDIDDRWCVSDLVA
jgi:hypothetical protein